MSFYTIYPFATLSQPFLNPSFTIPSRQEYKTITNHPLVLDKEVALYYELSLPAVFGPPAFFTVAAGWAAILHNQRIYNTLPPNFIYTHDNLYARPAPVSNR